MRLTFGRYKFRLISEILKTDPDYVKWTVKKGLIKLPKYLKL